MGAACYGDIRIRNTPEVPWGRRLPPIPPDTLTRWRISPSHDALARNFLGIINPENDAVYPLLKKGSNELALAVNELGGGWGFICRLKEVGD